ncbi:MAG: hypothetical protein KF745_05660 [Phycisphaeraceae bacterium]|nr:hypothetical protein [Phycisphaeraceae bacterium]
MISLASIREKPWFVWALGVVTLLLLLWIASFMIASCQQRLTTPSPPDSPEDRKAASLLDLLKDDERFRYLGAYPSYEQPGVIILSGELPSAGDLAALNAKIADLNLPYEVKIEAEPLHP